MVTNHLVESLRSVRIGKPIQSSHILRIIAFFYLFYCQEI